MLFLGLFAFIVIGGLVFHFKPAALLATRVWAEAPKAWGVMLFAMTYHELIPIICENLAYEPSAVRKALTFGSLLPLMALASLLAVTLVTKGVADPIAVMLAGGY